MSRRDRLTRALQPLSRRAFFPAAHVYRRTLLRPVRILLQDDIDLPVGAVRTRLAGGDGGHRGVRSVLEALQTFAVPRVKVGVGRPRAGGDVARHVLDTFGPGELDRIDAACAEAVSRTWELAGIPKRRRTDPATPPTPLTAASHRSPP